MDHFSLDSECAFSLPTRSIPVKVYKHINSDFRVVFIDVPGPLATASMVVGTLANNDKGLPHTLEHLIFCGSEGTPHRGYLDSLANRQLSSGTNAYTTEDHTAYTIVTAGQEGLCTILPIFLDHVLHPTLRDEQFVTEVYHVDGQGKEQGVVFSEMASRENSEADLLDRHLRELIYPSTTTYAYECGGLTPDIAKLTNAEIKAYHAEFYRVDTTTIILAGDSISPETVFRQLTADPKLLHRNAELGPTFEHKIVVPSPLPWGEEKYKSRIVPFPSSDNSVGSVGYAWLGPPTEDIRTIMAIDVLFRYLYETTASPFAQRFVEKNLASHVDYELKGFKTTSIVLVFSGVPVEKTSRRGRSDDVTDMDLGSDDEEDGRDCDTDADEEEDEEDSDDDESEEEQDDGDSPNSKSRERNLCTPGNLHSIVMDVIQDFVEQGFASEGALQDTLSRHRTKIYEGIEDDPHDAITSYLIPDILNMYFSPKGQKSIIGTRATIFEALDSLSTERPEFWKSLAKKWLLDAAVAEVIMIPDPDLGRELEAQAEKSRDLRKAELGEIGLAAQKEMVEKAVKDNEVNLPAHIIDRMPRIPNLHAVPKLPAKQSVHHLTDKCGGRPFEFIQNVETDTLFVHLKIALSTSMLDEELRPFLVLFQELIFNTPVLVENADPALPPISMDYRDLAKNLARDLVSQECSVGLGNDTFACSWLSETVILDGVAVPEKFPLLCSWLSRALLLAQFPRDRILTIAKNLLSEIAEIKREGSDLLVAVATRVTIPLRRSELAGTKIPCIFGEQECDESEQQTKVVGHDIAISMFRQEPFLRRIISALENEESVNEHQRIAKSLESVRDAILAPLNKIFGSADATATGRAVPGFVNIATPLNYESGTSRTLSETFISIWDATESTYATHLRQMTAKATSPVTGKRKQRSSDPRSISSTPMELSFNPFPFPRTAYKAPSSSVAVVIPRSSLTSSYLVALLPCDILKCEPGRPFHDDYYAALVLCEVISRNEGPLYGAVRGQGYAYDANLCVYLWTGQLAFEIRDASDPHKALAAFHTVLRNFDTNWNDCASEFDITTAQATCAYRACAEGATPEGVISGALRASLRGFKDMKGPFDEAAEGFPRVTSADLRRVFDRWFKGFLTGERMITILLTPPNGARKSAEGGEAGFTEWKIDDLNIE